MRELLCQYTNLLAEIKDLEGRILGLERQKDKIVHDSVAGSDPQFPHTPKHFHIEGVDVKKYDRLRKLRGILIRRKERCEVMRIEIEEFISGIPDSLTRRVFQYRYVDGLTWQAVAMRLGRVHESYPRRDVHDKYLENI